MSDFFFDDEFSAYDIDLINAKASAKVEGQPSEEEFPLTEQASSEIKEPELAPNIPEKEQEPEAAPKMADHSQKVRENKEMYDKLLAKVGKHPRNVTKEDVEEAVAQLDECITAASERPDTTQQQDASVPPDRRQAKRQRILSKQIADATTVFIAARCIGRCFTDLNQPAYYKHLGDRQFLMQVSMATKTFRERWSVVLKGETARQAQDGIDKITVGARRLAKSLAVVIDSFPGEGGMMALLTMISDKCDEDEFNSIQHTIEMAATDEQE